MYSAGNTAGQEFGLGEYVGGGADSMSHADAENLGGDTGWRPTSGFDGEGKGVSGSWWLILGIIGVSFVVWLFQDQLFFFLSGREPTTTDGVTPGQAANDDADVPIGNAEATDPQAEDSDAAAVQETDASGDSADIEGEAPAEEDLTAPTMHKAVVAKRGRRGKFVTLSFSWSEVENVDGYQLQLSRSPHFKAPTVDVEVNSNVLTKKHVRANVRYARVRAKHQDAWSPYSEVFAFGKKRSSRKRRGRSPRMGSR